MVKNKTLGDWKKHFEQELSNLYEKIEIQSVFKLLFEHLGWSPTQQLLNRETLVENDHEALVSTLEKLKSKQPIQYILGSCFFDDLEFSVNPSVLIPRPETEELVDWVDGFLSPSARVLDVCTGSGCIALSIKNRSKQRQVLAMDFYSETLETAKGNAKALGLNVDFFLADALESLGSEKDFDAIISNPPYIPENEIIDIESRVKDFEPNEALFVPQTDPQLFYRAIAVQSKTKLKSGGMLFFETHENFAHQTKALLIELGYQQVELKLDLQQKARLLKGVWI